MNAAFDAAMAGGAVDTAIGVPEVARGDVRVLRLHPQGQPRQGDQGRRGSSSSPRVHVQGRAQVGGRRDRRPGRDRSSPRWTARTSRRRSSRRRRSGCPRPCASIPTGSSPASASTRTRAWRRCARSSGTRTSSTSSACSAFPAGLYPQVAVNDKKFYPIYAKCVELDIPFCSTAGVPGPRVPFAPQDVAHIDEVCWFFPELKFVTRHGCEPWTDARGEAAAQVAEPLLLDHRVRAEVLPEGHHRLREHARRRQDHLRRATSPPGLTLRPHLQRAARRAVPRPRLAQVPPRERAERVFKLETTSDERRSRSTSARARGRRHRHDDRASRAARGACASSTTSSASRRTTRTARRW